MLKKMFLLDFMVLIIVVASLFIFKSEIMHVGFWLYELSWVIIIVVFVGIIFLKPKKSKVVTVFPQELAKKIEDALPHNAIKLYQSWLILSLNRCYQLCKNKQSNEILFELTKTISDKLVLILNRIPKDSLYTTLEERNKDNAFIALIFFTTIIKILESNAVKSIFKKPISAYRDVFTQIVLENASHFLFREHYRLYELGMLVSDEWSALNFNSDIETLLRSTLKPKLIEDASQSMQKPVLANEPIVKENNREVPFQEEKLEIKQEAEKATIVHEMDSESQKSEDISQIEVERCEKYFKWLRRQVDRKPVNNDYYFYQDSKKYGKDILFITDPAFTDFSKKTQINVDEMLKSLVALKYSNGKRYQLKVEGGPHVNLVSVAISNVNASSELNGAIEEVL